jgi:hypothetical protein
MKTNKYFTSDRRAEYLRVKNDKEKEKEKEDDNEENEEEEEEEEEDEKNKANTHAQKSFPGSRQPINKEIKSTIVKREEKSRLLNQVPNSFKQRVIYQQNQENESSKEGSSIRRALQEKKTQPITAASRILAKKEINRTGPSQQYTIKLSQNSPRGQLKAQNSQNILPPVLKAQNSQAQLQVKSRIPTKIETQSQAPLYQSKYSRRILESSVNNEDNGKEIKIINRNNNYTINVTNNNNTINVTNNSNNNDNHINNENDQEMNITKDEGKEEMNTGKKEIKKESRKEPRREIRKEPRKEEKESEYKKESEDKNENRNDEDNTMIKKENDNIINKNNIESKINESVTENNNMEKELNDRRKEYATNDIMLQNGVEIVKFSPEETKLVFDKKAENQEFKRKILENKKYKQKNYNNRANEYYDNNTNNIHRGHFRVFYQRGRDNFSKNNINDRDNFYKKRYEDIFDERYDYDNRYENYNNNTFSSSTNIFSNNIGYINNRHRRINNFYERGRPNPISRGFRGRRGRY